MSKKDNKAHYIKHHREHNYHHPKYQPPPEVQILRGDVPHNDVAKFLLYAAILSNARITDGTTSNNNHELPAANKKSVEIASHDTSSNEVVYKSNNNFFFFADSVKQIKNPEVNINKNALDVGLPRDKRSAEKLKDPHLTNTINSKSIKSITLVDDKCVKVGKSSLPSAIYAKCLGA